VNQSVIDNAILTSGVDVYVHVWVQALDTVSNFYDHRQRGSDCTVLTATGLVNGEWQSLTPYRIETPKPIDKKFCTRI